MDNNETENQSLIEHLSELRKRLMWVMGFVLIAFFICWGFSEYLFDFIRSPIAPFCPQKVEV